MKTTLTIFLFLLLSTVNAQEAPAPAACDEVFSVVEEMPVFSQGDFNRYVRKGLNIRMDTLGMIPIWIEYIINKEGKITDVKCIYNRKNCKECEEKTIKAIKEAPPWKPGMQNGKAVCVRQTMSVTFRRCR